ncbi:hemicentin-2 [Caerostris darwini]|uniref:Hemicentin-2 n=1 Tax=Caerostris darwini TaxID=1538125 RepID=A0AAV4QDB8_9ARAC|nr:hemicentin-2 [Caerostris darwini]
MPTVKPTDVHITTTCRDISVRQPFEIVCVAKGARPPAQVSWWLDGEKLTSRITESTSREENLTSSSLVFNPSKHDNQRNLSCRGDNPQLPDSVLEDTWVLDVHFPPELEVKINKTVPVFEDMSDCVFKVIEVDQSVNTSLTIDDGSCKYRELRSGIYYRDDPPLITTPLKIQLTKTVEIEKLDIQSTVETPLISSINPILQQFSSPNKKAIRVST